MEWNPDEVKRAVDLELIGTEGEVKPTYKGVATDKLAESAPHAAEAITRLAIYSENESVRLKAATYVLDRVFGRVTEFGLKDEKAKEDALSKFEDVIVPTSNNT